MNKKTVINIPDDLDYWTHYHQRGITEGIFGGKESKRHQLHCRFVIPDNYPPVRQDPNHHLEYQDAEPTQI